MLTMIIVEQQPTKAYIADIDCDDYKIRDKNTMDYGIC